MPSLSLSYAVHTVDNKLLLSADTNLTKETMNSLISSSKSESEQVCPILTYGPVKQDMLRFLGNAPYHTIFAGEERRKNILAVMKDVTLPLPLLQSLDYFRQHDFYTYRHVLVVFALSSLLARRLLPDYDEQVRSITTGPFHDIGKVCTPLSILKKRTPLTTCERKLLMHHTLSGYVLCCFYLRDAEHNVAVVARDHHERRDGSGHPRGIKLGNRMVEIISVCDIYDALISPRPYRPQSFDNRTALEEITLMAEQKKIGWDVVKALVAVNRKGRPRHEESIVSLDKRGKPPADNVYGQTKEATEEPCGD